MLLEHNTIQLIRGLESENRRASKTASERVREAVTRGECALVACGGWPGRELSELIVVVALELGEKL